VSSSTLEHGRRHRPVPYASVYASSKAAISCLTEALAHQLIAAGTELRAAVFYPREVCSTRACGPPSATGPRRYSAPGAPAGAGTTFEEFKQQLEAAGRTVDIMDLNKLGRFCVDGVKRGDFIIGTDSRKRRKCCTVGRRHRSGQLPPAALT